MAFFDLGSIVRMDAHAGIDPFVGLRNRNPATHLVRPAAIADGQDLADTGIPRPLQHVVAIHVEAWIVQMGMGVN